MCYLLSRVARLENGSLCPARPRLLLPFLVLMVMMSGAMAGAACPVPPLYSHVVTHQEADVLVSLGTDKDAYLVDEAIEFYLSFENTGNSQVVIPNPGLITPLHGFAVVPDTCVAPEEPCWDSPYGYPSVVFFFGVPVTLDPGECATYQHTWDGDPWLAGATVPGTYTVAAGMNDSGGDSLWGIRFFYPPGAIQLSIEIAGTSSVPLVPETWGGIKRLFR